MASSLTEGIPSDSHFHPAGPSEPKYFLAFPSPCPSPQQGFRAELERGRKGGKKTEKPRFLREGGEEREGQAQRPRQSRRPGGGQGKPGRPEGQRNRPRDTEMGRKISKDLAPPERSPCAAQAAPWGTSGLTPRGGRRSAPKLPGRAQNPGTTLAPRGALGPRPPERLPVRPPAENQPRRRGGPKGGAGRGAATLRPIWSGNPGVGGGRLEDVGGGSIGACRASIRASAGCDASTSPSPRRRRSASPRTEPPGGVRTGASSELGSRSGVQGGVEAPSLQISELYTRVSRGPCSEPPPPRLPPRLPAGG